MLAWLKFAATKLPLLISCLALLLMMVIVVVHVIGRNLFRSPLYGGVELISLAGVFLISFALGYAQMQKAHIIVEVLTSRLPGRLRAPLALLIMVVNLATITLLIWGGFDFFWEAVVKRGSYTLVLHLPLAPFRFIWVLGCAFLWAHLLFDLVELLRKGKTT